MIFKNKGAKLDEKKVLPLIKKPLALKRAF